MARIPNINIRTDPSVMGSGPLTFYIKVDEGKARRVQAFLEDFPGEVMIGSREGALKFAKKIHQIVRKCLRTGTPPKGVSWPPHSESTIKRLGAHKLLNLTGFYLRSIQIMDKGLASDVIAVGLPRGLRRPNNAKGSHSLTMKQIAQINEYGGGKVPARPLWRPAYQQAGGKEQLKKYVISSIRKTIRKSVQEIERMSTYSGMGKGGGILGSKASWDDFLPPVRSKPSSSFNPNIPDDLPF